MTQFTAIDLAQLTPPNAVEEFDFETIFAAMLADYQSRDPEFTALVESDPAYKILEVAAHEEVLSRQRKNEGARAIMLALATGADLDQIGANYNVARLVIDPGDAQAVPPVPPTYESDDEFRRRIQLSPEGYTTAGSQGSYVFHALGADGDVLDAQAISPVPGQVTVYVLSRDGTGAASPDLVNAVDDALNADEVRPLTDLVTVQSAAVTEYQVDATLTVFPGPDLEVVRQAAEDAVTTYVSNQHKLGYDITLSGLFAALHQPGVQNVSIVSPAAAIVMGPGEAAFCTQVTVTNGGEDV